MAHSVWGNWKITKDGRHLVYLPQNSATPNSDYNVILDDKFLNGEEEVNRLRKFIAQSSERDEALGRLGYIIAEVKERKALDGEFADDLTYNPAS